jgi:hypothetical protein
VYSFQKVYVIQGGLVVKEASVHTDEIRFCRQFVVTQQFPNRTLGKGLPEPWMANASRLRHFILIQKQIAYKILSRESVTEASFTTKPP